MSPVVADARRGLPRARRGQQRGSSAVEFALVMTFVLLPLLFGIMQYGLYFWTYQGGSDVTRDAARMAAVSSPVACTDFSSAINADLVGLKSTAATAPAPTITRTYAKGPGNTGAGVEVGDLVTVNVSFHIKDRGLPFVPLPNHGLIASRATSRVERVTSPAPVTC